MNEYLELEGAEGSTFRFRLNPDIGDLPAMAGNFVCVRMAEGAPQVVCAGSTNSLRTAEGAWKAAAKEHGAQALYVRLNVAGATRAQELESLVERHRPPLVISEGIAA